MQPAEYRIVRTIPSYFPNVSGPANQARAIARGLVPLGFRSRVVTTNFGAPAAPPQELLDDIEVWRAPIWGGVMQYHLAPAVWTMLCQQPADLIHVHSYRNFLADAASILASRRRIPLILHLHGTLAGYRQIVAKSRWWAYAAYDWLTRPFSVLRADHLVVSTPEEAHEAEQYGLDPERITVIPMGIDLDHYSFPDIARDHYRITFVGRLTEDRNPELLLRALALLPTLPWTCTLVGDEIRRSYATTPGYSDYLIQITRDLGIADRVTFTGQLHGAALRQEYARAGIFVYPSRYENFGQTILEAAAAGCALVTTPVGVAHDLVDDGRSGFLIETAPPELLAQRLAWLLEHPAQQAAMGQTAADAARHNYAWGPILQRYANLYTHVLTAYQARGQRINQFRAG